MKITKFFVFHWFDVAGAFSLVLDAILLIVKPTAWLYCYSSALGRSFHIKLKSGDTLTTYLEW